jgi:Tfp pilus assembly protein PilF
MSIIGNLEKLLFSGQDNAMLRFGLGNAYFQQHDFHSAVSHLQKAVCHDPDYSAAWKLLGKALAACQENAKAIEAFEKGILCAEKKGDIQAVKEMTVFLKRLSKA